MVLCNVTHIQVICIHIKALSLRGIMIFCANGLLFRYCESAYAFYDSCVFKLMLSLYCLAWHTCLAKILILIYEGIIKKISYERRDYGSVDDKSLLAMSRKTTKKRIQAVKV